VTQQINDAGGLKKFCELKPNRKRRICRRRYSEEKVKVIKMITDMGGPDAFCAVKKNAAKYPKFCNKVSEMVKQEKHLESEMAKTAEVNVQKSVDQMKDEIKKAGGPEKYCTSVPDYDKAKRFCKNFEAKKEWGKKKEIFRAAVVKAGGPDKFCQGDDDVGMAEKKEDLCKKWKQKQDARKALAAAQKKEGKVPKKKKTKAELKKDIMTAGGPSKWCADTDNMTAQPRFCAEVMRREIKKREEEASRKKAGGKGQYKDFKTQMMEMIKKAGGLRKYCKTLPNDAHDLHKRVCKNMNKLLSHCFKLRDKVDTGKMEETKKTKLCSEFIDHQRRR